MAQNTTVDRAKQVQELRKAHFHLGFDDNTNYQSVAKDPTLPNKKQRPQTSFNNNLPPPQLQKNNFNLGTDKPIMQSINQTDYQRPHSAAVAKLSEETKKDLRSHHFQLGFNNYQQETEYKQNYHNTNNKPPQKQNNDDLRKHHHDFGDTKDYYSTMYDQLHNKQYDSKLLGQGMNKQQMMEQNIELRKTNLIMGRDDAQYQTQTADIHKNVLLNNFQKPSDVKSLVKQSHIQFGDDKVDYTSQVKGTYQGNQSDGAKLNQDVLKDLRATHFQFGNSQINYQSAYNQQYKDTSNKEQGKVTNPLLQQNHFDIADTNKLSKEEHYKSTYNNNFNGRQAEKPIQVIDKSNNVKLGQDKLTYTSEAAARFKDFKGKPGQLQQEVQAELRNHHYKFGDDGNKYESQTKATHLLQKGGPSKLDEELKKDLRAHHFHLGFSKGDFKTHHQEIGSKQGPPNKLPPEVAKRIKAHSYQD